MADTAASTALPPHSRTRSPIRAAIGWLVAIAPFVPKTTDLRDENASRLVEVTIFHISLGI
jgi:hypothetical protein